MLSFPAAIIKMLLAAWFYSILLLMSDDVELNLGLKPNCRDEFSICQFVIKTAYLLTIMPSISP